MKKIIVTLLIVILVMSGCKIDMGEIELFPKKQETTNEKE